MAHTISIDVIDARVSELNHVMIPIVNQPNPCKGYTANAYQVRMLIQMPSYRVYAAGTDTVITAKNYYSFFPEEQPGGGGGGGVTPAQVQAMIENSIDASVSGTSTNAIQNKVIKQYVDDHSGGGGGDKSRYTVTKVTDDITGEVTYKLMQSINDGSPTNVGDIIGFRGGEMLVQYGNELTILNSAIADIKEHMDANYNFTTFTELNITTSGKTLKQITDELYAKNLPTNTIVTGQLYSSALPFAGNGEAEVMVNSPAFWWTCKSLTTAPYSWNAIAGGGSWSGVIMDWTPTYNNNATGVVYDNTASGASSTNVQDALDETFSTLGDVNSVLEGVL